MKNLIKLFFTAILFLGFGSVYAQDFTTIKGEADNAFMNGNNEEAITKYKQLMEMEGDSSDFAMIYAYAGLCSKALGQIDESLTYLHKALEYDVRRSMIYDQMIGIAEGAKNYDEYEFAMCKKMDDFPHSKNDVLKTLVTTFYKNKMYDQLVKYTGKILELYPTNRTYITYDAIAKQNLNKNDEAVEAFKKLIKIDPSNAYAQMSIGMIYYKSANAKWEKAKKDYESGKQGQVEYAYYRKSLGPLRENYKKAIPYLVKAYEINSTKYASLKPILNKSYTRIEDMENAAKYE